MFYVILIYLIYSSKSMISSAIYFGLFCIKLGLDFIFLNHNLSGLLIITIYVGAIIILVVFLILNLDLSSEIYNVNNYILLLLLPLFIWDLGDDLVVNLEENYYFNYNLSNLLFEYHTLLIYLLCILLLLGLKVSIDICKKLY